MIHKKFISIFLSIFLLISLFPTYHAVENNTITVENYGLIEDPYERLGAGFIDDSGNPIVGNTLNATCVGSPEKVNYDVNYQWQVSVNGTSWFDITNANSNTYTISNNEYDLFIRVKVTSNNQYGNVVYPLEKCSISTKHKVVILGDVDLNGTVNTNDAILLSKYLAELATLNERQLLTADANKDGVINVNDVRCIQQIASS